jgi:hypothetical protein
MVKCWLEKIRIITKNNTKRNDLSLINNKFISLYYSRFYFYKSRQFKLKIRYGHLNSPDFFSRISKISNNKGLARYLLQDMCGKVNFENLAEQLERNKSRNREKR